MKGKEDRQNALLDAIRNFGRISINALEQISESSRATFQRDLVELERKGKIVHTYGIVKYAENLNAEDWGTDFASKKNKTVTNLNAKMRIGRAAQQLIEENDTVFITHGTTTRQIFENFDEKRPLTVFTDGLDILWKCMNYPNINVYLLGGKCNFNVLQMEYTPLLTSHLDSINIKKLFMGVAAISSDTGVTFYDFASYQLLRLVAERVDEIIVMADSTKFGRNALVECIPLKKVSTIITDMGLTDDVMAGFVQNNIRCVRA